MSLAILHSPGDTIKRYEEELFGVLGPPEQGEGAGGPAGGGQHEPIATVTAEGDLQEKEREEAEKQRAEERAREKVNKEEAEKQRAEEKAEHKQEREEDKSEAKQEREREEKQTQAAAKPAPTPTPPPAPAGPPEVVGSHPQPITRGTSSRTSGGTGRT